MQEIVKSGVGSLQGLGKSKKYGLTVAFVATTLGMSGLAETVALQIAGMAAATLAIVAYLFSQGSVEKAAAESNGFIPEKNGD